MRAVVGGDSAPVSAKSLNYSSSLVALVREATRQGVKIIIVKMAKVIALCIGWVSWFDLASCSTP
jgi:hypothetical protein